ncbi:phosphodiesterase [Pseudomonas kuykendallii]|uniref:phosphodiesterase n=1 Tax=Pseudomonas kuykendallii TaxID=1007099 RepID=UPI0028D49969|nr:phosphodiesterase [Pseudomonas kuykendallii]
MKRALLLIALLCAGGLRAQSAQTIEIPLGEQGRADLALPARGDSQRVVLEHFGLADEEHPAVGRPPITRWDYREFSVYFESGRVIDSVRHHQPHNLKE